MPGEIKEQNDEERTIANFILVLWTALCFLLFIFEHIYLFDIIYIPPFMFIKAV